MMIQALFQVVLQLMERVFLFLLWFWSKGNQFNGKQDGDFLILYCYLKPTYSHLSAVVHNLSVLKLS
ncbi:MAG: hypothetical protein EGR34_05740 [Prevotella sp.]|nr:hypothetical protein [Prevotella sp.]